MNNSDKVYSFLERKSPRECTNADIASGTGIRPHAQIFQITQKLLKAGRISGRLIGKEWIFWVGNPLSASLPAQPIIKALPTSVNIAQEFERFARAKMSTVFNTALHERAVENVHKRFDFVSDDGTVIGDAKYYSLVNRERFPPAKISVITEHVWLLEKTTAQQKFLVFGNQIEVPQMWLERYGNLLTGVDFFFLEADGQLNKLN